MHIVASSFQVFLQTQQHVDTYTLMRFHDLVQHIIGQIEEHHRTEGKQSDPGIVPDAGSQRQPKQITNQQHTNHQLNICDIKRYHIYREEESHNGHP